ncbi:hypothetical protein DL98DRAFT_582348 [Cadophora sp. DSE1049]|nr:hypothetical protein DL98DRAFT_582348 [Cadophora sp. DSE1049]
MANIHEGATLKSKTSDHPCQCAWCFQDEHQGCRGKERVRKHCTSIGQLLAHCGEIVTVLIGPSEAKFVCHKAVLGFWSEFFDAAFYGNMKEAAERTIRLPEEHNTAFEAFVTWAYTGQVNSDLCPEELWALGDRLRSPKFSNAVMYLMFNDYSHGDTFLSTKSVEIAFSKTAESSQLQNFLIEVINSQGPLCKTVLRCEIASPYVRDWQRFIQGGGELVLQIVQKVSLINDTWSGGIDVVNDEELPW